jgi:predicted transcriptional regulator
MSQQDVFNILKKKKKWMTTKEVAKVLNQGEGSISKNLKKLSDSGDILVKKNEIYHQGSLWKTKED